MKYSKRYPWVLVMLLWGVALLNYMDRQMLSTMRPAMQQDIAELNSAASFGSLMAIFLWIYGLMSPVSGFVADKLSKKWLIIVSLFVWSGVTYAMGYATTYSQILWLRALMGISEALYIPAGLALISSYHPPKTRSLAIGIHMTGLYTGQALGGFGATIAAAFSWHATFHILGFAGMVYAIVLILLLKDKNKEEREEYVIANDNAASGENILTLLLNISFWILVFCFAITSLPGWAAKNWLPTLFSENLNLDMSHAGPASTITIAASSFLGVIFGGILSDRWVQKNIKGRIYTSACGLAFTVPSLLLIALGHSAFNVIGAAFCFGFGYGMFDANNMPVLCQFVPVKYRATAYGIMNMAGVFAGAFVTELLGRSTDEGNLGSSFAVLALILIVVITVQLFFLKPKVN
ncbi:MFS transporter [Danxiaibacter flavus]|uniref:MFS transporter n=1 Tax=Danxiaibacter flavus TaxID=3049108 RepID=A0ABV3ZG36_9BACT|nr:MFS transporter [Chitinophagaceae bacterium DXS]